LNFYLASLIVASVGAATAAEGGMTSREGRYLNLAEESPTFRSIVQVIPTGTLTAAPRRHKRTGPLRADRAVLLTAVISAMIGWLTVPAGASAARTMTILMTVLAVLSLIAVLATGETRHRWRLSVDPERNAETRYFHPTTEAKVELDARFEGARPKGRSE
jgi:hypothetical protein